MREGASEGTRPKLGRPKGVCENRVDRSEESVGENFQNIENECAPFDGQIQTEPGKQNEQAAKPASVADSSKRQLRTRNQAVVQKRGNFQTEQNETLSASGKPPHPDYVAKGPIITTRMFNQWTPELLGIPSPPKRPVRSTRNANPQYIDGFRYERVPVPS